MKLLEIAEIWGDGKTVWVNGSDGCCIGRFCKAGIDIHHDAETQIRHGRQCLGCKEGPTTIADWESFKAEMKRIYNATITDTIRPRFLDEAA